MLSECGGDRGLDISLFQRAAKLHLTFGTLTLLNEAEVTVASELLQDSHELLASTLGDQPLILHLRGLEYMNDAPTEVDVLYAQLAQGHNKDRLQLLADGLVERFVDAGLLRREFDSVKLHVTLMNTFRRDPRFAMFKILLTVRIYFFSKQCINQSFCERRMFDGINANEMLSSSDQYESVQFCIFTFSTWLRF